MAFVHPSVVAGVQTEPFGPPHSSSGLDARSAMIPGGAVDGFSQLMKALVQAPLARRQMELRQKEIDRRDQIRQDSINERARHDQSMEKIYAGRGGLKQRQIDPYKHVPRVDPNTGKVIGHDDVLKSKDEIDAERKTRAMLMGEDDGESNESEPDDDGRPDGQPAAALSAPPSLVGALGPAHAGSWLPSWLGGGSPAPAAPQQDKSLAGGQATGSPDVDMLGNARQAPPSLAAALPPQAALVSPSGPGSAFMGQGGMMPRPTTPSPLADAMPAAPTTAGQPQKPGRTVAKDEFAAYLQKQSAKQGRAVDPGEAAAHLKEQGFQVEGF